MLTVQRLRVGIGVRFGGIWPGSTGDGAAIDGAPSDRRHHESRLRTWFASLSSARKQTDDVYLSVALTEVAHAVSSASTVDEVLGVIVDHVRAVTGTQKALLVLADELDGGLDMDTLVVRGMRERHPQASWEPCLRDLAAQIAVDGRPMHEHLHRGDACMLVSPVSAQGSIIGYLGAINTTSLDFNEQQQAVVGVLAAFAGAAIETARLSEEQGHVLLSSERQRIAQEMHDGVMQSLFSISLGLEVCRNLSLRDSHSVPGRLEELQEQLDSSMTELRRHIYDLRPTTLSRKGLAGAIEEWLGEASTRREVITHFTCKGEPHLLPPAVEVCLFRVAKEAVSNALRHGEPTHIDVVLGFAGGAVELTVRDDGCGFDTDALGDEAREGLGVTSMRQRMGRVGGSFELLSEPGNGTTLKARV